MRFFVPQNDNGEKIIKKKLIKQLNKIKI